MAKKLKHQLKDDRTDIAEWYDGEVVSVNGDIVTTEYVRYTDIEWDIAEILEDIHNSDLKLL